MKRIVTLLLAAGLLLGGTTAAQAIDIKMGGTFDFVAQWGQKGGNKDMPGSYNTNQNNSFYQRFRAQIDIIASEALRGVVMFEIGDQIWGRSSAAAGRSQGGGIGADGVTVEVKRAYLDWIPPHTDLQIRMGIQGFTAPTFVQNSTQIFDDDVAGITLNYQFTPNVGMTAWWFRPYSDDNANYTAGTTTNWFTGEVSANPHRNRSWNEMDMFGLAVPLTFDGVKITPWGMYAAIGRDANAGYSGPTANQHWMAMFPTWVGAVGGVPLSSDGQGNGWWLGLTGELTLWNPFRLAWDFNYGNVDMGHVRNVTFDNHGIDVQRAGWYASILAEYKLDFMTPGLAFWYASGDDSDWRDGSEMMPMIKPSSKMTSFGQDGPGQDFYGTGLATGLAGTWGIMAQLKDLTFVQDLKHNVRVAYYRGTNSTSAIKNLRRDTGINATPWMASAYDPAFVYMTTDDSAWEFNLDTYYDIYKNLQLGVELGYIKLDIDSGTWGRAVENRSEDMYKIAIGMRYTF